MTSALSVRLRDGFRLVKRLSGAFLRGALDRIGRRAIIDLDAAPFVPEGYGWTVHEGDQLPNRARGTIDIKKVSLRLASAQKNGVIVGHDVRKDLADVPVLNANALDFLLKPENKRLVSKEWRGNDVFFWGTIYRRGDGTLFVRYLYWNGDRWRWSYYWLDDAWDPGDPSAVLASSA